jgi:phosphoglycolate phosphatase
MEPRRTFIFDFDGTLCDSGAAALKILRMLGARYRFKIIEDSDIDTIHNLSSTELIKFLGISTWKIPLVMRKARREFHALLADVHPFPGMVPTIHALRPKLAGMGLLTSNSVRNVSPVLAREGLEFDYIRAGSSLFGKKRLLAKILKSLGRKPGCRDVYYIGDETRDIDAAKQTGIVSVAVTWGYQSENVLKGHHPDFLIHKPEE